MKLFQVTVPNEFHSKVVSMLQDVLKLDNVTSIEARTSSIVTFRVEDEEMQSILNQLQKSGVGVQFGFCDVMSLTPGTTLSRKSTRAQKKNVGRILERSADVGTAVPVAEMYAYIESRSTLSRDSVGMLLISSAIAGIGLAGDSGTYVVASMLLSPLMGPIIGCAFGFAIRDRNLFMNGLVNEIFALVLTLLLGILIGALLSPYAAALNWPTNEMRSRGQAIGLLFGAAVAALSGTGAALAESNANISSVVGIAIAAALLPPTVNCGICLSYVFIGQYFVSDDAIGDEQKLIFFEISVGSAMLVWINIILIYFSAVMVFKIKNVGKFQLIRRIDEDTWKNLPPVEKTFDMKNKGQQLKSVPDLNAPAQSIRHIQPSTDRRDLSSRSNLQDSVSDESYLPTSPLRRRAHKGKQYAPVEHRIVQNSTRSVTSI